MQVFVFDSGLAARTGHHYEICHHLTRYMERLGVVARLYVYAGADLNDLRPLRVTPLFRNFHYKVHLVDPYSGLMHTTLRGATDFSRDIASLGAEAPGDDDIVVMPTAGVHEAAGLLNWMQSARRRPRVIMIFHHPLPWALAHDDFSPGSVAGALYRQLGAAIMGIAGTDAEGFLLATTSARMSALLSRALGHKLAVLPAPIWYGAHPLQHGSQAQPAGAPPTLTFLGIRRNKGFAHIPGLVRELHRRHKDIRFVIQGNPRQGRTLGDLGAYRQLEDEGLARVIFGWLEDEHLGRLVRESALVVMPYNRADYRNMISGSFALCVAAGRPCVVPADTWMADQITAGTAAGVVYEGNGNDAIAAAVADGLARLPALLDRAHDLATPWRATQSGEALMQRLSEWAGLPPPRSPAPTGAGG